MQWLTEFQVPLERCSELSFVSLDDLFEAPFRLN